MPATSLRPPVRRSGVPVAGETAPRAAAARHRSMPSSDGIAGHRFTHPTVCELRRRADTTSDPRCW